MPRFIFITAILVTVVLSFTFFNPPTALPAKEIKSLYLQQTGGFIKAIHALKDAVQFGNEKKCSSSFFLQELRIKKLNQ